MIQPTIISANFPSVESKRPKYHAVNSHWPEGTDEGRAIKPTPQEAMRGFRMLYRKAFGRAYRGTLVLTSGNRRTGYGSKPGTVRINPDECGGGWHEIVHSVSHMASWRLYRENHGPRHAWIERELIAYAVSSGFLDGRLRREPKPAPEINRTQLRRNKLLARIKRWEAKRNRAENAIRKLARSLRYLDRRIEK